MSAAPSKETIYIDLEDEITTIIDKVERGKSKIVALVLPKRMTVLQSIVNMRLLKRAAANAGKRVVLITSEAGLLPLAGAAGLHVAKSLQSKPSIPSAPDKEALKENAEADKNVELDDPESETTPEEEASLDHSRPIGELAGDEPETIALDSEEDEKPKDKASKKADKLKSKIDKKLKVPNFDRFRLLMAGGVLLLILLVVLFVVAAKVLPKATITIKTDSTPVSANFTAHTSGAAKTVDKEGLIMPATSQVNKQTSTQQTVATGQQNNGAKASGKVVISNCAKDGSTATIPLGSTVSSGGMSYVTQSGLDLGSGNFTAGGSCKTTGDHIGSVNIVAVAAGQKYNLSDGQTFAVAGQESGVTGTNSSDIGGGTDNIVAVVSQNDINTAQQKFNATTTATKNNEFVSQLGKSGFYVITAAAKTDEPSYSATPAVGQPGSTVTVTQTVNYTVLTIKKSDMQSLVSSELSKQIDPKKQRLSPGDILADLSIQVQSQPSPTDAILVMSKSSTAMPIINEATIQQQSVGKKSGDIRSMIGGIPGVKSVDIKYSPFWVSKAPSKNKIKVILQQVTSTKSGG